VTRPAWSLSSPGPLSLQHQRPVFFRIVSLCLISYFPCHFLAPFVSSPGFIRLIRFVLGDPVSFPTCGNRQPWRQTGHSHPYTHTRSDYASLAQPSLIVIHSLELKHTATPPLFSTYDLHHAETHSLIQLHPQSLCACHACLTCSFPAHGHWI
jgi:hypothetical protein